MRDGGKGDTPRPLNVSRETFENNFDAIFGKKQMTTYTTEDRVRSVWDGKLHELFAKQFPDLVDNHIAWMCFREGFQRGQENVLDGIGYEYT
jgi:hypothetical protein